MTWKEKGWSVSFYEELRHPRWHWVIKRDGKTVALSHRGYEYKTSAQRAFWSLFNVKTLAQLEEAYAGSKG